MTDLIRTAAAAILTATQKRSDNISASLKREIWEVGKAFLGAINSSEEIKAVKRIEIAKEYSSQRTEAGLQPMAHQYWLKALQLVEAMPSKAFYQNLSQSLSVSCLHELAPLSKPKNFSVKIDDIVKHILDQDMSTTTEIRSYIQSVRKVQPKKSASKKPVTTDKGVAMARQIAKQFLDELSKADPATKAVSLQDAIEGKCTKRQAQEKLADVKSFLFAMASAK